MLFRSVSQSRYALFVCDNICTPYRELRTNLWIQGPPGCAKSNFLRNLISAYKLNAYYKPYNHWDDDYLSFKYHLVICDEFKGGIGIQELNRFTDGQPTPLLRRNESDHTKIDNPPTFILSNFSPDQAYANVASDNAGLKALKSRFKVVHFPVFAEHPTAHICFDYEGSIADPFSFVDHMTRWKAGIEDSPPVLPSGPPGEPLRRPTAASASPLPPASPSSFVFGQQASPLSPLPTRPPSIDTPSFHPEVFSDSSDSFVTSDSSCPSDVQGRFVRALKLS